MRGLPLPSVCICVCRAEQVKVGLAGWSHSARVGKITSLIASSRRAVARGGASLCSGGKITPFIASSIMGLGVARPLEMGAAHALPAMHTLAMHTLHMNATAPCTVSKPPPDGTRDIAASAAACSTLRAVATRADATALCGRSRWAPRTRCLRCTRSRCTRCT